MLSYSVLETVESHASSSGSSAAENAQPSAIAFSSSVVTAPATPPADWQPTRLGISYRPCRLAVEYVSAGKAYRKLMPVAGGADDTPERVLTGLERDFGAYLDFEEKLSRSQTLRLVEMLLASAA